MPAACGTGFQLRATRRRRARLSWSFPASSSCLSWWYGDCKMSVQSKITLRVIVQSFDSVATMLHRCRPSLTLLALIFHAFGVSGVHADEKTKTKPQYEFEEIVVPRAHAEKPIRSDVSVSRAADYLDKGALVWSRRKACVSCHTNGAYLQLRPALTPALGPPSEEIRTFAVDFLKLLRDDPHERPKKGPRRIVPGAGPTQIACIALELAEWDVHVRGGQLSTETQEALRLMFKVQSKNSEWGTPKPGLHTSRARSTVPTSRQWRSPRHQAGWPASRMRS